MYSRTLVALKLATHIQGVMPAEHIPGFCRDGYRFFAALVLQFHILFAGAAHDLIEDVAIL